MKRKHFLILCTCVFLLMLIFFHLKQTQIVAKIECKTLNFIYSPFLLQNDSLYKAIRQNKAKASIYKNLIEKVYLTEIKKDYNLGFYCKSQLKGMLYAAKNDTHYIQIRAWKGAPQYYYYYWFSIADSKDSLVEKRNVSGWPFKD